MMVERDEEIKTPELLALLDLEEIDTDLYTTTAPNATMAEGWTVLYGGQVAAQSLIAAGRTVAAGRFPHSLHGYFLRAGRQDRPVVFRVTRDRDGRSFSARHVAAQQDGKTIFSMLASFCERAPESVLDEVPSRFSSAPAPEGCRAYLIDEMLEVRAVTPTVQLDDRWLHPDLVWARVPIANDVDPMVSAAVLTYFSDLGTGFGQSRDPRVGNGGSSLDHAVWFHERVDVRDWTLLDMWPVSAVAGRGVYHGSLRDRHGRLAATLTQETLLRSQGGS